MLRQEGGGGGGGGGSAMVPPLPLDTPLDVFEVFLGRAPNCDIFYERMFFRLSKFETN